MVPRTEGLTKLPLSRICCPVPVALLERPHQTVLSMGIASPGSRNDRIEALLQFLSVHRDPALDVLELLCPFRESQQLAKIRKYQVGWKIPESQEWLAGLLSSFEHQVKARQVPSSNDQTTLPPLNCFMIETLRVPIPRPESFDLTLQPPDRVVSNELLRTQIQYIGATNRSRAGG
jgi:hypothetical protein